MEINYLQYIEKFLNSATEMKPAPTLLKPFVRADPTIRALAFDVYGTILVSASGDIDESVISADNLKAALDASGIELVDSIPGHQQILTEILDDFKRSIRDYHEAEFSEDKPYPEINVLEIWEKIILHNQNLNLLRFSDPLCIKCFTFIFEVLSNRIYPMPGMKEVINLLAEKGFPLGIVSNAQFYTPVILNFFLHGTISDSEQVQPFDADLTVFSFQHQRSKPDAFLFELLKKQYRQKYGIYADEILFIGNDMFRDIYPAREAGLKTALFAGDTKSLRLRQEKPELKKLTPDYVVTDLYQILNIIT
jgi:putative hydrolase of the HAD superfamily